MLNTIGFRGKGITVDSKVSKLSGGERQGVAIGRAMHFEAELIILDEPTVALSLKEVRKVLNFVHKIKEAGKACIYISHNLTGRLRDRRPLRRHGPGRDRGEHREGDDHPEARWTNSCSSTRTA